MEFGYFIMFFGLILFIIGFALKKKGQLTPKNPNCSADIKDAEMTKLSCKALLIIGPLLIILGLIVLFIK